MLRTWCLACLTLVIGCGSDSDSDKGGTGGSDGDASAGGTSSGGTPGTGGTSSGGNSSGGTSSGGTPGTGGTSGDGGPGTGGTNGADGSTTADATADGATASDAATGCAALAVCCESLTIPALQTNCEDQAGAGNDMICDALSESFCGTEGPPDGAPAAECVALAVCCDSLSGGQETQCNQIADLNIENACGVLLAVHQADGGGCN